MIACAPALVVIATGPVPRTFAIVPPRRCCADRRSASAPDCGEQELSTPVARQALNPFDGGGSGRCARRRSRTATLASPLAILPGTTAAHQLRYKPSLL